ncbi:MAG: DUF3450 domain-containing protein [Rhodothalassiaceae bacterium]
MRLWIVAGVIGASAAVAQPAQTPEPAEPVKLERALQLRLAANQDAREAQARIDRLDDETQQLVERYRRTLSEIEASQRYVAQIERLIADQEDEIESYEDRLERVGRTQREIIPLMLDMIDHLERFIEADMPFLIEKRRERVDTLRYAMDQADIPTAEKTRLVLQAYRIEADYGTSLEAYRDTLPDDPDKRVEFLRIGRVALVYRTPDGREAAVWDRDGKAWRPLDQSFQRQLDEAFKIARQQAAPDLLVLPMPTPEGAQ